MIRQGAFTNALLEPLLPALLICGIKDSRPEIIPCAKPTTLPYARPTAPPTTEAPEGSQVASGFLAKQKKYNYGENNIVMLNVTNQNKDNYSVKVEGYYLDANGAVLKTETKFV